MNDAVITIRTDSDLKKNASELFDELGMNISVAVNMFLKQAVREHRFPCSLDLSVATALKPSYIPGYLYLFGSGKDLDLVSEAEDLLPEEAPEL